VAAAQAPDVVFVATPLEVVVAMLKLAGVTARDVVYDPGSGDGRIPIAAAARFGARAVGIEIDSNLVAESRCSADSAGVGALAEFRRGDLFRADLREATVVTLYLGRTLNQRLRPKLLRELRPGTRVVSQNFDMGDWKPDSVVIARGRQFGDTPVHLWVIPSDASGSWDVEIEGGAAESERLQLRLAQRYQKFTGEARSDGRRLKVTDGTLRGELVALTVAGIGRFQGRLAADSMHGTITGTRPRRWHARRHR
jgi:hypothetical protein